MEWTILRNKFLKLRDMTGAGKLSSYCMEISFQADDNIYVLLGTYDIGDWPRHLRIGPFKSEEEAHIATSLKIKEAEDIVWGRK